MSFLFSLLFFLWKCISVQLINYYINDEKGIKFCPASLVNCCKSCIVCSAQFQEYRIVRPIRQVAWNVPENLLKVKRMTDERVYTIVRLLSSIIYKRASVSEAQCFIIIHISNLTPNPRWLSRPVTAGMKLKASVSFDNISIAEINCNLHVYTRYRIAKENCRYAVLTKIIINCHTW